MFYIAVALVGIYTFGRIGVDLLPNVSVPNLIIQTSYPFASAEEVEKMITEPLESATRTVTGVKKITSVSKEGLSIISISFNWGTDMDFTLISLREKLDNARFLLPLEASRPTIIRIDPASTPIMSLVLTYNERNLFADNFNTKEKNNSNSNHKISFVNYNSSESEIRRLIDLKEASRVIFKRRLEQIDGVAQAIITGGLEKEFSVEIDLNKLNAYNLSFSEIADVLKKSNVSLPAGSILKGQFRYALRTIGEFQSKEDIEKTAIKRNTDGSVIYVSDIANVKESFKEREGLTRFNGNEAVGLLIYKEPESNTVEIALKVNEVVKQLRKEYPDYELQVVSDFSKFIVGAIDNVKQEIYYGGILAFIVLFFFLASVRNIFIIGITIPTSLLLTIILMYLFNISFNIISLGGIAVGVGMLLDNSIIVVENITRYKEMGLSLKDSTLHGSNEVAMPVLASTLTTIAVFIPLIFLRGIAGELFKDQSYAVIFSLATSLLVALTLVPMLSSREKLSGDFYKKFISQKYIVISKPATKNILRLILFWLTFPFILFFKSLLYIIFILFERIQEFVNKIFAGFFHKVNLWMEKLIELYEKILLWSLDNRKTVLLFLAFLIFITVLAFINIKKEFIPEGPEDELIVDIIYPKGTSLEGNAILTAKIENSIQEIDGVESIVSNIGRVSEFDILNRDQTFIEKTKLNIKLKTLKDFYKVRDEISSILGDIKNISYNFKHPENAYSQLINPSQNDVVISIKNKDIEEALQKAELIIKKVNNSESNNIREIQIGTEKGAPEYRITIVRDKCISYGINLADAANQIVNIVKGNEATFFSDFDKKVAIKLKANESQRNDFNKILNSFLTVNETKIPVQSIIQYELTQSMDEIWRENQARTVNIYASLIDGNVDKFINKVEKISDNIPKTIGENIIISGVNTEMNDEFKVLYFALIISVLLMYMVLASEFESFLFPFIIIFSIPMGLIGSILLLYVLGESISIISVMGLIILVGIADNDAVVKVEFILRKRKEGLGLKEAITEAGRDRFRPIVMNSFTVIFALIPMILGIGAATQLRVSLSIAVAGGLISSTVLTLFIIPVIYTYMESLSRKKFNK